MIYIFTAIYAEAKNIIKHYDLKLQQRAGGLKFDIFANEDIRLLITGTGAVNAAAAVGNAGGVFDIGEHDVIINIGSCAMPGQKAGNVYIINKITEEATGRTFYPDMLMKTGLDEAEAFTVSKPFIRGGGSERPESGVYGKVVYEMEAAAIYQAASFFVGPDRISFIKIVSDNGELISKEQMQKAADMAADKIYDHIDQIKEIMREEINHADRKYDADYKDDIERLSDSMCCSKVMKDQLSQIIKYCYLSGIDYRAVEREFYDSKMLPCSSKKEGKICLEKFKNRLL